MVSIEKWRRREFRIRRIRAHLAARTVHWRDGNLPFRLRHGYRRVHGGMLSGAELLEPFIPNLCHLQKAHSGGDKGTGLSSLPATARQVNNNRCQRFSLVHGRDHRAATETSPGHSAMPIRMVILCERCGALHRQVRGHSTIQNDEAGLRNSFAIHVSAFARVNVNVGATRTWAI